MLHNTTGSSNVAVGVAALLNNKTGEKNVIVGYQAGESAIGSGNVFIGSEAGRGEENSDRLYIANTETKEPLIWGNFAEKALRFYTTKLGFFGKVPVVQPAKPATLAEVIAALEALGLVA